MPMFGSRLSHAFLCLMVLASCILLVACGGSSSASTTTTTTSSGTGSGSSGGSGTSGSGATTSHSPIVYVAGSSQNFTNGPQFPGFIDARVLDVNSGTLAPVPGSPFSVNYSMLGDMALSPDGGSAYVLGQTFASGTCCVGPTSLLVYALDPVSGAPTLKQALATNASEISTISVYPSGQFVYLTNYSQSSSSNLGIAVFSVQADGTLAFSGFTGLGQPETSYPAVIDPNGKFLYTDIDGLPVTNLGNNACGPFYSNVYAFSIDPASGALTPVSGSPFTFQRQICEVGHAPQWLTLQMNPSGQQLYLIDSGNRTITVFAIDSSSGALALLPGTTVDTTAGPSFTASAIDPNGLFLYVGGPSYAFTGFNLTANPATGDLPVLPGMPVLVTLSTEFNAGSRYMAIDPSGTFLFGNENEYTSAFSCCQPDQMVELRIDPNTGALTPMLSNTYTLAGSASKIVVAGPR